MKIGNETRPVNEFLTPTIPADNTDVIVPLDVLIRHVYGAFRLNATATTLAKIGIRINDVEYNVAQQGAGDTVQKIYPYSFTVRPGQAYRFLKGGGALTTEVISFYTYTDVYP